MSFGILVQGFKMPILVDEYKIIFLGKRGKRWNSPKTFLYIWVSYKFVSKSEKSLNRISWATKYWFKALKCQIWLTNTKPFFWKSEANVETLQKPSPYIWVSYKFVLKCGEDLSLFLLLFFRMFWILNIQLSNIQLEIM